MKGYLEIFKGPPIEDNLIYSDNNLIVDGAGAHVADILANNNSSSIAGEPTSSISDFGIKAMTLASPKGHLNYNSYNVRSDSGPSSIQSIISHPEDITVQPASESGPGNMGHFLNYYNFSGLDPLSALTVDEIHEHGCYLPSGGITFDGSTFGYTHPGNIANDMSGTKTGVLNAASAINSDGFILESTLARSSQTLYDASAGFIVSAIGDVSSTRQVKYILTVSYEDWKFLDYYYGGIGAIGLWTLDREATLVKYGDELQTANIDLYNVADISKNPVFRLFSKKTFLPGGLKIDTGTGTHTDYLTISWSIKF